MLTTKAVYGGTFDPPTLGHLWMINEGAKLFSNLTVAVAVNPEKKCMFSPEDRLTMIRSSLGFLNNVSVFTIGKQFLISFAESLGADFILRGIRNQNDCEYERAMRNINGDLNPNIGTVFLMPPREIAEVSSSLVKGLVGPEGWESIVAKYVTPTVLKKLKEVNRGK